MPVAADLPTPSWSELQLAHRIYREREPRDLFYRAALQLVAQADAGEGDVSLAEALALLLTVWNIEYYRFRPAEKRALVDALEALLEERSSDLVSYRPRTIASLDDAESDAIIVLFDSFRERLGPVGAAKALHLLAPTFFPLWDDKIRRAYRVSAADPTGHARRYWEFMQITRHQVGACSDQAEPGTNLVKAMDEYNYARFTLRADDLNSGEPRRS